MAIMARSKMLTTKANTSFDGRSVAILMCLAFIASLEWASLGHCRRLVIIEAAVNNDDPPMDPDVISSLDNLTSTADDASIESPEMNLRDDAVFDDDKVSDGETDKTGDEHQGPSGSSESNCGQAPLNRLTGQNRTTPFIVNGEPQVYGEWPSFAHVSVYWAQTDTFSHCGGVLISDQHVLTSAHCLFDAWSRKRVDGADVILGEHLTGKKDEHEVFHQVKSICVAKKYKPFGPVETAHNFAVLRLKHKVNFTDYHQPACLPDRPLDTANATCYFVGGGATNVKRYGKAFYPKTILKMQVRKVPCGAWRVKEGDPTRECYTKADGEGNACLADHGGPVLCLDPSANRWTVVGTFSYGPGFCKGDIYGWTSVYARTAGLLADIKADCKI